MSHFTGTRREGRKLVLNRVLAYREIDKKRKRGFCVCPVSRKSRGNCHSAFFYCCCCFSWNRCFSRAMASFLLYWGGGGITCYRPFIMAAQATRLNTKRSDVPAVLLAARPYPHKCLVAPCLSSNPATDGSASSKMQNLRLNLKSRRCLQVNNKFSDRVPL